MNWTDLTENVGTYLDGLRQRFPNVQPDVLASAGAREEIVAHLAQKHDLTEFEAFQELDDWLYIEGLARQALDFRAG